MDSSPLRNLFVKNRLQKRFLVYFSIAQLQLLLQFCMIWLNESFNTFLRFSETKVLCKENKFLKKLQT